MRIVENRLVHRLIQQLSFTKNYTGFKLSHRFRADQTFHEQISTQYRFRYRLASEIALDGLNVDPKEFYLKINNEYLNILRDGVYDLEIRLTPFLGYKFTDSQKLEIGIDYRFKSFIRDTVLHQFWLGINWYQVF